MKLKNAVLQYTYHGESQRAMQLRMSVLARVLPICDDCVSIDGKYDGKQTHSIKMVNLQNVSILT